MPLAGEKHLRSGVFSVSPKTDVRRNQHTRYEWLFAQKNNRWQGHALSEGTLFR